MDTKELRFSEQNDDNGLSDKDTTNIIKENKECNYNETCYVNKGFNDINGSKEELSDKVEEEPNHTPIISEETTTITPQDGYVNNGFEEGPQKSDKGTVPLARDATVITSTIPEEQISKLDEDNNGVVAVNVETKEKKRKVQLVRWEFTKSIMLLGLFLAFDVWAAVFYCFKTDVLTNILN